jgi:hypothetical protein
MGPNAATLSLGRVSGPHPNQVNVDRTLLPKNSTFQPLRIPDCRLSGAADPGRSGQPAAAEQDDRSMQLVFTLRRLVSGQR